MVKTLPVEVYYNSRYRECANGGITAQEETLYLVDVPGAFFEMPDNDPRLLRLVNFRTAGGGEYIHAEMVNPGLSGSMAGPMMGGNFVYSCDSRFPSAYPIPVHDRYESWDLYNLMFD